MMNLTTILGSQRIARAYQQLRDIRVSPTDLPLLSKAQIVPAMDEEIVAKIDGQVVIADIVADDAEATVKQPNAVRLSSTKIPNIKLGRAYGQRRLEVIQRVLAGNGSAFDLTSIDQFLRSDLEALQLGTRHRMEQLLMAMATDDLDYDRGGIKMTNVSWGMPSDLKITPSTAWDTANKTTSTPLLDILTVARTAREKYGISYDRIMMSSTALDRIAETTEFANKAKAFMASGLDGSLLAGNIQATSDLIGRILGLAVEVNDGQFVNEAADGARTYERFLPVNYILLYRDSAWQDGSMDFANGIVTESLVSAIAGSGIPGGLANQSYGPVGYVTASPDLNPPNLTLWSVARGFPRKHFEAASARITGWSV